MLEHNRVDELVKEGDENVVLWMSAGYNVSSSANHKHVQDICTKRGTSRSCYTLETFIVSGATEWVNTVFLGQLWTFPSDFVATKPSVF